jgi:hypothetical protein
MRAFYGTYEQIRLFVLGTPEGQHIGMYDLQNHNWMPFDLPVQQAIKDAKVCAQQKAASMLGA